MITLFVRALHWRLRQAAPKAAVPAASGARAAPAAPAPRASAPHASGALATPCGHPLPHPAHAVLPEPATRHRRVIIVGDVHGCAGELRSLLDRLAYRRGVDVLCLVGDLVNKGPASAEVLRLVAAEGGVAARGNHDDAALAEHAAWRASEAPPAKGKYAWVVGLAPELVAVLEGMPLSVELPGYRAAVVHAGAVPGRALEAQSPDDLLKMRDVVPSVMLEAAEPEPPESESDAEMDGPAALPPFDWDACVAEAEKAAAAGSAPPPPLLSTLQASERRHPGGRAWASVWRGPQHIFFGHDASRKLQIEPWATGLDGGCVYGGCLWAAVLPPLDEAGREVEGRWAPPPGATELRLGTGARGWLVGVPATAVHSPPKIKAAAAAGDAGEGA